MKIEIGRNHLFRRFKGNAGEITIILECKLAIVGTSSAQDRLDNALREWQKKARELSAGRIWMVEVVNACYESFEAREERENREAKR